MDPTGYRVHAANVGIKDETLDFLVVASDRVATVAATFTRSLFAGPSVVVSREVAATGHARAVVVVSKNANVATGEAGLADARELQSRTAALIGVPADEVLVASTGVIGRRYPIDRIRSHLDAVEWPSAAEATFDDAATAIMTTDTRAKVARTTIGDGPAQLVGIAKGVGMIEPDMATLLTFLFTDAEVGTEVLDPAFRRVVDRTFNSLSIDTDTSTSDPAMVMANGAAGPVGPDELEEALERVALELVRMIASDGEGATKRSEVTVTGGRDDAQSKRVAKAVVNSPLVKTAVHGADPNWGRIAMAVGKCREDTDVRADRVAICIGGVEMYPAIADEAALDKAAAHMRQHVVEIDVDLGIGPGRATVYGCDLSDGYIRINADYTT
jgi:glutamate N-acetyltransferase / amino-acid N-acetyltransferase